MPPAGDKANPLRDYYACAEDFGKLMSAGTSTAAEIGDAAVWFCRAQRFVVSDEFQDRARSKAPNSPAAEIKAAAKNFDEEIERSARQAAIYYVVTTRATKQRK